MKLAWGSLMQSRAGGYGRVGMMLAHSLEKHVDDISLCDRFALDHDWRVIVAVPYAWLIGPKFNEDLIWHTMVECRPLPKALLPLYRLARYIWVPSEFVRDVMLEADPYLPVLVSGYGFEPRRYPFIDREDPERPARRGDRPYRFFAWTDGLPSRKGPMDVMRAFDKLNLPDCELVVKMSQDGVPYKTKNDNIKFLQGNLSWYELTQIMGMCDTMVYPSRGEGFGLMPLEAMATGLCVIVPKASGMAEFVREEHNLVIPIVGQERVVTSSASYECDQFGHVPDKDVMTDMMQWCYDNQHEAYLIGQRASEYVYDNWTWEHAAHKAAKMLRGLGSWRDG